MNTICRYFHTVRYLRLTQVLSRIWFQLYKPDVDRRAAPRLRPKKQLYAEPIACTRSLIAPEVFCFLNVRRRCASAADWHPREMDKLWIYNLHYFDDLNSERANERSSWHANLLERWARENAPGAGDAWEPYPVSRRIVNWVKWTMRGNALGPQLRHSLAMQARWLMKRLEYHILGNHLLANGKALVHGGLYFDGPEAEQWRIKGQRIIARELHEQILRDGGHFELSTMYHATVIEDLLDLINLERAYGIQSSGLLLKSVNDMRRWLRVMSHPDGDIAFFNDSAFAVAPAGASIDSYFARLGLVAPSDPEGAVTLLRDSGYVRMRSGPAYLLCDCAAVGPDYLPGHAHADTLSFELSLFGRRLFVNSGTSQYGVTPERHRQRSTAAHNTVVVNDEDSSEVWGGFRVARRARTTVHHIQPGPPAVLEAGHDGYRRLAGRNEHRRRWILDSCSLGIEDRISGAFQTAEAFFHLHPEVEVRRRDVGAFELSWPGGTARMTFEGACNVEIRRGFWHPKFGMDVENTYIVARFEGSSLATRVLWTESQ